MLVRNVFEEDFVAIGDRAREWGDLVIERETVYHMFCAHFRGTCFVAEDGGKMIGYLLGFRSQTYPGQAYMHLLHVDPKFRGYGVGRRLFSQFLQAVKASGCTEIKAISRPENKAGMAFYRGAGFKQVETGNLLEVEGVLATKDYNGPGKHRVVWGKEI